MNQIVPTTECSRYFEGNNIKTKLSWLILFDLFFFLVEYMASCRCSSSLMVMRIFVLFCSIYWGSAQNTQSAQKPNIIMIVADDLVSKVPFLFRIICLRYFFVSQNLVEVR